MKRANGEGNVRKKGRTWYVRISSGGGRREMKTAAANRTEALAVLNRLQAKMAEGNCDPDVERTRVADLFQDMQTDYAINRRRSKLTNRWKHLSVPPSAMTALNP